MPDNVGPVTRDQMTMKELAEALHRGTRFCSDHLAMDNWERKGQKGWMICLARLPKEVGRSSTSRQPPVESDFAPGRDHQRVWVADDEETRKYFRNLWSQGKNPDVFHVTREMIFIRLDIAKFTKFREELQPRVIAELHELVHGVLAKLGPQENGGTPERVLHTGDGFILAYPMPSGDARPWPLELAQDIAGALDRENDHRVPFHFRISVTLGDVYVTGDLLGQTNYIGSAITETERLLQCIPATQDDVICFSDRVYRKYRESLRHMKFFRMGSVSDKHKQMHRLYLLEYEH